MKWTHAYTVEHCPTEISFNRILYGQIVSSKGGHPYMRIPPCRLLLLCGWHPSHWDVCLCSFPLSLAESLWPPWSREYSGSKAVWLPGWVITQTQLLFGSFLSDACLNPSCYIMRKSSPHGETTWGGSNQQPQFQALSWQPALIITYASEQTIRWLQLSPESLPAEAPVLADQDNSVFLHDAHVWPTETARDNT